MIVEFLDRFSGVILICTQLAEIVKYVKEYHLVVCYGYVVCSLVLTKKEENYDLGSWKKKTSGVFCIHGTLIHVWVLCSY